MLPPSVDTWMAGPSQTAADVHFDVAARIRGVHNPAAIGRERCLTLVGVRGDEWCGGAIRNGHLPNVQASVLLRWACRREEERALT